MLEDKQVSLEELVAFLKKHLSKYKIPKSFEFVDSTPKLSNGKIDRGNFKSMNYS